MSYLQKAEKNFYWLSAHVGDVVSNLAAWASFFQAVEISRRKFTFFCKFAKTLSYSK